MAEPQKGFPVCVKVSLILVSSLEAAVYLQAYYRGAGLNAAFFVYMTIFVICLSYFPSE